MGLVGTLPFIALAVATRSSTVGTNTNFPSWTSLLSENSQVIGYSESGRTIAVETRATLEFYDSANGSRIGKLELEPDSIRKIIPKADGFVWVSEDQGHDHNIWKNTWQPKTGLSRNSSFKLTSREEYVDAGIKADGDEFFVLTTRGMWVCNKNKAVVWSHPIQEPRGSFGYAGNKFVLVDHRVVVDDCVDPHIGELAEGVDLIPFLDYGSGAGWQFNVAANALLIPQVGNGSEGRTLKFDLKSSAITVLSSDPGDPTQFQCSLASPMFGLGRWFGPIQGYTNEATSVDILDASTGKTVAKYDFSPQHAVRSFAIDPSGLGMVAVIDNQLKCFPFPKN